MFVRLAILISLAALGLRATAAADDGLVRCDVGEHGGYLVSADDAEANRADILATLPKPPVVDSFWNVSEQVAITADRKLRESLEDAVKDPTRLFPSLTDDGGATGPNSVEYQREELKQILANYGAYERQFVGLVVNGHEIVLMNYAMGPRLDPASGFIFIHRVFEPGRMHFLQARYNWDYDVRTISNVSTYGPWQDNAK